MNIGGAAEKKVYDAASREDVARFHLLVFGDPFLINGASFTCSRNLLHIATLCGQAGIVEAVLNISPRLARSLDSQKWSPLHIAAAEGNLEIAKKLLSVAPEMCWSRECQGMNPVHIAAMKGHVEILKEFLELNYLPAMERVHRGQTVLHLCMKHRQLRVLEFLMEEMAGEFVCAKDDDGDSIFHWAVRSNQIEAGIVEAVLNISPRLALSLDSQNWSPLHIAAAEGNLEITKKLLTVAPEMCWSRDCQGKNPIHIAAMKGHVEILHEFLELDSLPAMERVHRGQTVLHLCVKHRQVRAFKFLVEEMAREFVSAKDDDGDTVLHWAVRSNQVEMVRCLVESNKIRRLAKNSMGKTALNILTKTSRDTSNNNSAIRRILTSWLSPFGTLSDMSSGIIMVVIALIATMAFQAIINPPGGVWRDDSSTHQAGKAVMSSTHPKTYHAFLSVNAAAFVSSFITIFLLSSGLLFENIELQGIAMYTMWCSIVFIVGIYGYSLKAITPDTMNVRLIHLGVKAVLSTVTIIFVILLLVKGSKHKTLVLLADIRRSWQQEDVRAHPQPAAPLPPRFNPPLRDRV